MIKPICFYCKKELNSFGGILLSPPKKNKIDKYHICRKCFGYLLNLNERRKRMADSTKKQPKKKTVKRKKG